MPQLGVIFSYCEYSIGSPRDVLLAVALARMSPSEDVSVQSERSEPLRPMWCDRRRTVDMVLFRSLGGARGMNP